MERSSCGQIYIGPDSRAGHVSVKVSEPDYGRGAAAQGSNYSHCQIPSRTTVKVSEPDLIRKQGT